MTLWLEKEVAYKQNIANFQVSSKTQKIQGPN
jgi:hypothetical protein